MKPRSLIFTLYGDYLRYCNGGEVGLGALTDLLAEFDVDLGTTRTVMARLRAEGWFETRRQGRRTFYRLTPSAWRLLDEGRTRIFVRAAGAWAGEWTMVATRTGQRSARDTIRRSMAWHGFGQLQSALWLAPGDRRAQAREVIEASTDADGDVFLSRTGELAGDRELAARCWPLDSINEAYRAFVHRYDDPAPVASGRQALRRRVALTDDYRRFPFTDPDLPSILLPASWHGATAQALFAAEHARLRAAADAAVEEITGLTVVDSHRVLIDAGGMRLLTNGPVGRRT